METQTASRNDTLDIKQLLAVLAAVKKGRDLRLRQRVGGHPLQFYLAQSLPNPYERMF